MPGQMPRLIRLHEVCSITGYSKATIWRLVKAGKLTKPVHLGGGRACSWPEAEVTALIETAIAARDETAC